VANETKQGLIAPVTFPHSFQPKGRTLFAIFHIPLKIATTQQGCHPGHTCMAPYINVLWWKEDYIFHPGDSTQNISIGTIP